MHNYLIDFFKEENTLIIPGFGALTVVSRSTNELMFMPFLKHNDGSFEKKVAEIDGVDISVAKDKVQHFIDEINSEINQGKKYVINQIGVFSKDGSGDVLFSPITSETTEEEVPISDVVETIQPIIEETPEEIKEEVIVEQASPIIEIPKIEEEIKVDTIDEETKEIVEEVSSKVEEVVTSINVEIPDENSTIDSIESNSQEQVAIVNEKSKVSSEEEQWKDDLDLPPLNYKPEKPKKPILEKTKKDKKPLKLGRLVGLLLLLLLIAGVSYIGFNYKDFQSKIPFLAGDNKNTEQSTSSISETKEESEKTTEENVEKTEKEVVEEQKVNDDVQKPTELVEQKTEAKVSKGLRVDKQLPIQIIVGSFGDESNAIKFVEKLKSEGFPAEIIGVYGGLHTISAASFHTMDDYTMNQGAVQSVGKFWIKK